jgi:hypothetical protein
VTRLESGRNADGIMIELPQSNEHVQMIGHSIYGDHFVFMILNDAGYILERPFFPFFCNLCFPLFESKNVMDM